MGGLMHGLRGLSGLVRVRLRAPRHRPVAARHWRHALRRPLVAAPVACALLATAGVVAWTAGSGDRPPASRRVAAPDGTIAPPRMAYFSNQHPSMYERYYYSYEGSEGESLNVENYREGRPDDQPSGRNGRLVFVTYEASAWGATERDGDIRYQPERWAEVKAVTNDDVPDAEPDISPDGSRIVFASMRGGAWNIWVVDTDGTNARQLTNDAAEDSWPRWSPDGQKIAFHSTRDDPAGDIYTIPAAGGTPTRLTRDPGADTQPAWSPDGRRLSFTTTRWRATGDVVVMPAAGGTPTRVGQGSQAVWSQRRADTLLYVDTTADRSGWLREADAVANAVPRDPPGGSGGYDERHPAWVSDTWIVTVTASDGYACSECYYYDTSDVWSIGLDGTGKTDLTMRPNRVERAPAYSPDGRRLAYAEERDHDTGITVSDADGRNPRVLTTPPSGNVDGDPAWSPDGTLIAYSRKHRSYPGYQLYGEIRVVDAATGAERGAISCTATAGSGCDDGEPAWSPDGRRVAFTRHVVVPPTPTPSPTRSPSPSPSPSPEETIVIPIRELAGALTADSFENSGAHPSQIWTIDVDGQQRFGSQRPVTHDGDVTDLGPAWSPDGQWIAFAREGTRLLRMRPDGSGSQTLLTAATGDAAQLTRFAGVAYSPDGGTLAFTAGPTGDADDHQVRVAGNWWSDIYAMPSGGGTPRVVVADPGEDSQPAFQPSADIGAALKATPSAIPVSPSGSGSSPAPSPQPGFTSAVELTVTNHGWSAAPNTVATLTVPAGLRAVAIRTSAGSCVLDTRRCALGTVAAGDRVTVTLTVTGTALGTAVVTAEATSDRYDPDPSDNTARTSVIVGAAPDVTVAVTAAPETGYVGGDPIVVTYTVTGRGGFDSTGVKLVVGLPVDLVRAVEISPAAPGRACDTPPRTCAIGTVGPPPAGGQSGSPSASAGPSPSPSGSASPGPAGAPNVITVKVTLDPKTPVNTVVTGVVSADSDADAGNNTAEAPIKVLQPALVITPRNGEAGFVPKVLGTDFPPGAQIIFVWDRGITQRTPPVTVAGDGTLVAPMMVFNRDLLGMRTLRANPAESTPAGTRFGTVTATYLVASGHERPEQWLFRR